MSGSSVTDVRSYRWSSADDADRFSVENPATGEVIAVVQGACIGHPLVRPQISPTPHESRVAPPTPI